MLTKQQVEEIRARAEKATKGPWEAMNTDDPMCMNLDFIVAGEMEDGGFIQDYDPKDIIAITLLQYPRYASHPDFRENQRFIAHAREDVPALLADNDALREEVERLKSGLRQIAESRYCDYAETSTGFYKGPYGIGVTDGHRYCANIARKVLGKPSIEDAQEAPDEA